MLTTLPIVAVLRWSQEFMWPESVVAAVLAAIFFLGSRDTLRKYYQQGSAVLRAGRSGDQLDHADAKGDRESLDVEQ
jgi:hypothetical protein